MTDKDFDQLHYVDFSNFLEQACGIVLGDNKQYLVRSRLTPLIKRFSCVSINAYIDSVVKGNRQHQKAAIEAMTTNETLWFRDDYPFKLLESTLLKQFSSNNKRFRIWSAACSSGQEAYSVAMTILNFKKQQPNSFRSGVEIVGTDISEEMLQQCRTAEYDQLAISRGLPEHFKSDFFEPADNDKLRLKSQVRALTTFKSINLLESYSSVGKFDIVFCRNVLIYFSPEVKKLILQKIAASLQDDGILFLGASESLSGLSDKFTMVRCSPGLYYLKKPL
ncbi:protein-glutamate O-methyltransferase CheR [uncultured Paraglaciecola sp.]|uniref:CheR family methyltransferase n=1 Tax=uncultured Paraglaciecola sp. TaxID=1765024 RepID=UPI0025D303D0|nr:protein-glutamate O-methyltransferase CheR [uncultured Paraglaciecola sp.]